VHEQPLILLLGERLLPAAREGVEEASTWRRQSWIGRTRNCAQLQSAKKFSMNNGSAGRLAGGSAAALPFDKPEPPAPTASQEEWAQYKAQMAEYRAKVDQWRKDTPKVTRNSALGALTALLLGLVGSVIGGWMASGEPMTFTYYRTRRTLMPRSALAR